MSEAMLALADCLLDSTREQWERMQAAQDLDGHGEAALPYLFEAAAMDWSHDPGMRTLIGGAIATIWSEAGTLRTASTEGLPSETVQEIEAVRRHAPGVS
jgi:hypothetical protein